MKKARIKSVLMAVVLGFSVVILMQLAMVGLNLLCPEIYQKIDPYLFDPREILSFLLVFPVTLWGKMKITNFKVKNFLSGVFGYGILLVLFALFYIIVSIVWMKKWGWLYVGTVVYFDFIKKNILYCLIGAISEEFIYRGVILNILFKNFSIDVRKDRMIAGLCSGLIFGLVHANDFFAGNGTIYTGIKIITGFLIGFFFSAVYIRENNIFSVMFLHALINYALDCNYCTQGTPQSYYVSDIIYLVQIVLTIILFIQGIIMLWKDKNEPQIAVEAPELQDAKEA